MGSKEKTDFANRMKEYENASENYLDKTLWTVIRIDGHGFSKWTKGFEKPFDDFLLESLSETARSLMEEFKAVAAYSQSDEITLILKPDDNLIYSGRVQKIVSLMASFASMRFNDLVREGLLEELKADMFVDGPYTSPRRQLLKSRLGKAFFDARVFQVPTEVEAFNSLLWRLKDCKRNSKNVFAQSILSHKECMYRTSNELVDICLAKGFSWHHLEPKFKYGILWKKESYKKVVGTEQLAIIGNSTYDIETCIRTRFVSFSKEFEFSEDNVKMVTCTKL